MTLPDGPEHQVRGLGTDVAIVSSMVFLAQFILSLCMGSIISAVGSTTAVVCAASVLAFCGAISATQVVYLDLWEAQDYSYKIYYYIIYFYLNIHYTTKKFSLKENCSNNDFRTTNWKLWMWRISVLVSSLFQRSFKKLLVENLDSFY